MKKFNITVNGKSYQVEVEEAGSVAAPKAAAPVAAPAPVAASAAAPAPAAPAAPVAVAPEGGETVTCPMPGNLWKIVAQNGATVNEGDIIMILEAMKMENEIYAPCSGTVTILAKEGTAVNSGDPLFTIS